MVLKFWDIDNGKVTCLKYTNSKNESSVVNLKRPNDCDEIPLSKLEEAMELIDEYVSSVEKLDNVGVVKGGKDNNTETKPENNVHIRKKKRIRSWVKRSVEADSSVEVDPEQKVEVESEQKVEVEPEQKVEVEPEQKVEVEPEQKVEVKSEREYDIEDDRREVPQEVSDKLGLLLKSDGEKKGGVQFLINKNVKKVVDIDNNSLPLLSNDSNNNNEKKVEDVDNNSLPLLSNDIDISVILRGNAIVENRLKKERKERFSKYEKGIINYFPEILESIEKSDDKKILVDVPVFAKKMGKEYADIKPATLYTGIKYLLFDYGIIVKILSSDGKNIFRLSIKNEHDKLPQSILKQRNEIDT